jgi:acetoin utilization deacetylase AcuC-like enzyme
LYPAGVYNYPIKPGQGTSKKWRKAFSNEVIPQLLEFNPDFILISAGFDAHQYDHLHHSHDTTINEFDYQWVTQQLIKVANSCC